MDKTDKERFESAMKNWGICYGDWAGGRQVYASDNEIAGGRLHPDSGDWIVYDERGQTGFIGVPHDAWGQIEPIKLKPSAHKDVDLSLPEIPRAVSTIDLMKRYLWITDIFIDWLHVDGASPYLIWKSREDIDAAYAVETASFADDPWLATYWLLHFGLCNDERYADVAAAIRAHGHDAAFDKARWALAFFDSADINTEIDLTPSYNSRGEDYSGLFLRRRANLLYLTYSQSYRGGGGPVDNLWHSVSIYRGRDKYAIRRMRWLRNNLEKHDLWTVLDARLNDPASDDIPFICYPRALQSGRADASERANAMVAEMIGNPDSWRVWNPGWAKIMLWDVRDIAGDGEALMAAAETVFTGDIANEWYADILTAQGKPPPGGAGARETLAAYQKLFDGMSNIYVLPEDERRDAVAAAHAFLADLSDEMLSFLVDAVTDRNAATALWHYFMVTPVADQDELIVRIFPRGAAAEYHLKYLFDEERPDFVTSASAPVFKAAYRIMTMPQRDFADDHARRSALRTAAALIMPGVHRPDIFELMVKLAEQARPDELTVQLFSSVFSKTFDQPVDPVMALSREQLERVLDAVAAYMLRHPEDHQDARRMIFYCANPEAIPWLKSKLADRKFLSAYAKFQGTYDPLSDEIKDALEAALEWHEEHED